jgi:dipeptidyl aminopeptidase/acylaminoacyl peptidase
MFPRHRGQRPRTPQGTAVGVRALERMIRLRIFTFALALAVAAGSLPALAAPARMPLAQVHAALDAARTFDQVAISPDGTRVAWSESGGLFVAEVSHPRAPQRLRGCASGCIDGDFAWSPDGTRIAFLTTGTEGQAQLAVATVGTGAVRRLTTDARGPLASPKWSPDGTRIAVLYTKDGPKSPGPLNPLPPAAGVIGSTSYEQRLAVFPAGGGALKLLGPADLYIYEYDWSPDGTQFAATGAHGSGDDNWWIADLFTVDAHSGAVKKILHPATQIASPRFSGDGTRIAYIGGLMSDESITGGDVYVVSANGGAAIDVTDGLRASVTTIAWNASRTSLVLTELAGGEMQIARLNVDTREHHLLFHAPEVLAANLLDDVAPGDVGVSLARDGVTSALIRQSFTQPPEVYAGPLGKWHAITARNATVPRVVDHARSITWKSDAFQVQGWLLYPHGYVPGRKYPMVVIVHGGPAYASYALYPGGAFAWDAELASQGYFVLEPNARGSYGEGEAFTQGNVKDFGGGDLRDILAGVDAAEHTVAIDDKRVGLFGWSYGGYMTMWALTQTTRFRAAVSGAGLSDWLSYYGTNDIDTWMTPFFGTSIYNDPAVYAKSSPINFIKQVKTPTLMVAGDRDAEVPVTQSYEYWHALRERGVPTQLVIYPGEGHLFSKVPDQADVTKRLVAWFDRWMH